MSLNLGLGACMWSCVVAKGVCREVPRGVSMWVLGWLPAARRVRGVGWVGVVCAPLFSPFCVRKRPCVGVEAGGGSCRGC